MLAVSGLHFRYAAASILTGVDVTVGPGEIVSLVGPNGAGKSTLLKCIDGILRPNAGSIVLEGRPTSAYSRRELARAIAYVPQQGGTTLALPVVDVVGLGRLPYRGHGTRAHDAAVVTRAIERMGLVDLAFRLFGELSGGERQRVLLARALAQEGRLLLLDEPTAALDLRHQLETMTILRAVVTEGRHGALIALHDLALASRFSDRLIMLSRGRVHAAGAWSEVLTSRSLEQVYGVSAVVGTAAGLPYVVPTQIVLPPEGGQCEGTR